MHVTSLSGSVESPRLDENDDNIACETENNCTFDIGWSSANIYTSVRPKFILSLQPAWFLNSLKFSIDEHVGFSRNITLHVPLQIRHNLPVNTTVTVHEIMHFLQRATSKVTITTIMLLSIYLFSSYRLKLMMPVQHTSGNPCPRLIPSRSSILWLW